MVKIVFINKSDSKARNSSIKQFDVSTLHKKCNLKTSKNFKCRNTWNVNNNYYSVFAKDSGRESSINKYDLPPPIDNIIYYGHILIIKHNNKELNNNTVNDLTKEEWLEVYEKLFGGFENLESEEESEEEEIPAQYKTKEGYSKEDGFIVDDEEEDDEEEDDDEDYVEEEEYNDEEDEEEEDEEDEYIDEDEDEDDEDEDEEDEDEDEEDEEDEDEEYYSGLSEDSYITSDEEN